MPALKKELNKLVPEDFELLVDEGWSEDEQLEFKQALSQGKPGEPDLWKEKGEIRPAAKRDLLAEVVAMANSYGGDVVLGIEEADQKPPIAIRLVPIANCAELAARIEHAARDLIRPQIPMLAARGVPLDGDAGVVVIRAPRSRMAPHRLEMSGMEKECYRRVNDRTEPMSMREIQDLTFTVARGLAGVDERFKKLSDEFADWFGRLAPAGYTTVGLMVAAVPSSADLEIQKVHGIPALTPVSRRYAATTRVPPGKRYDFSALSGPMNWRPILRGTQGDTSIDRPDRGRLQRLTCDGVVLDMSRLFWPPTQEGTPRRHVLYPSWLFATIHNVLESLQRFRAAAGASAVEYAIEIKIASRGADLPVMRLSDFMFDTAGPLPEGTSTLVRYAIGEPDTWNDTLALIWADFWNSAGTSADGDVFRMEGLG